MCKDTKYYRTFQTFKKDFSRRTSKLGSGMTSDRYVSYTSYKHYKYKTYLTLLTLLMLTTDYLIVTRLCIPHLLYTEPTLDAKKRSRGTPDRNYFLADGKYFSPNENKITPRVFANNPGLLNNKRALFENKRSLFRNNLGLFLNKVPLMMARAVN